MEEIKNRKIVKKWGKRRETRFSSCICTATPRSLRALLVETLEYFAGACPFSILDSVRARSYLERWIRILVVGCWPHAYEVFYVMVRVRCRI
jgi:hypothetical protein